MMPKCYSYLRFSTPDQAKGDSLRRQTSKAQEYAEKHGLIFDTELSLEDRGVSAFSGAHRQKGAFGAFLDLVEEGKIVEGSTLVVESLDRLSRENVFDAFNQFREIIGRGVKIVTLDDGQEYTRQNVSNDFSKIIISLSIMARSHEESKTKSERIKQSWEQKRRNVERIKLTSRCPAWLSLTEDKTEFILDKERAKRIKRIFKLSVNGYGTARIAKMLNEEGLNNWGGGSSGWYSSYVNKILKNKAVLGEFQPHTTEGGQRVPAGDPISDYYPRIIDEELFYQVQHRMTSCASSGGKNGAISNLFGGLAKCGFCGAPMQLVNKGKPPKGGKSLVCDSARRGMGCKYISIRYEKIEQAVLAACSEIDVESIIQDEPYRLLLSEKLRKTIESCSEKILQNNKRIDNLIKNLSEDDSDSIADRIKKSIAELEVGINQLKLEKDKANIELDLFNNERKHIEERVHDIRKLYDKGQLSDVDVRTKIRSNFRAILESVDILPANKNTDEETVRKVIDFEIDFNKEHGIEHDATEIEAKIREGLHLDKIVKEMREIRVNFKSGKFIILYPSENDSGDYYVSFEKDGDRISSRLRGRDELRTVIKKT